MAQGAAGALRQRRALSRDGPAVLEQRGLGQFFAPAEVVVQVALVSWADQLEALASTVAPGVRLQNRAAGRADPRDPLRVI
jgi:hypothetical protein